MNKMIKYAALLLMLLLAGSEVRASLIFRKEVNPKKEWSIYIYKYEPNLYKRSRLIARLIKQADALHSMASALFSVASSARKIGESRVAHDLQSDAQLFSGRSAETYKLARRNLKILLNKYKEDFSKITSLPRVELYNFKSGSYVVVVFEGSDDNITNCWMCKIDYDNRRRMVFEINKNGFTDKSPAPGKRQ